MVVGSAERIGVHGVSRLIAQPMVGSSRVEVHVLYEVGRRPLTSFGQKALTADVLRCPVADETLLVEGEAEHGLRMALWMVLHQNDVRALRRWVQYDEVRRLPARHGLDPEVEVGQDAEGRIVDVANQINGFRFEEEALQTEPLFVLEDPVLRLVVLAEAQPDRSISGQTDVDAMYLPKVVFEGRVAGVKVTPVHT